MERFEIMNCGHTRNFLDGHGSYLFIESRRIRYTSDPELAKLLATNPRVSVTDRKTGKAVKGLPANPPPVMPPKGPPPPIEADDEIEAISYDALDKREVRDIAKKRGIPTAHVRRRDMITALEALDREEKAAKVDTSIDYEALSYKDIQQVAKERGFRYVGVSRAVITLSLQTDDKVEPDEPAVPSEPSDSD